VALTVNQHDAKEVLNSIPEQVVEVVAGLTAPGLS
jgi:hypothetical protein